MSGQMQSYGYQGASTLLDGRLVLQTSGGCTDRGPVANPRFFTGFLTAGQTAAAGLLTLADLACTDFRRARQRLDGSFQGHLDPIVTSGGDRLRFESLSACCSVYGRLDVPAPGLDGDLVGYGTTNVDVNPPLYTALTRVGGGDPLRLVVGPDDMIVTTLDGAVVEKKVPLPQRWLRSLAEVPAIAARFDLRAEMTVPEAAAFINRLPAATSPQVRWLTQAGRSLRTATAPSQGAVCLAAADRLALLRPLLRFARGLRLFGPPVTPDSGPAPSGWELDLGAMRFILLLSPGTFRGFSGEGALLTDLAGESALNDADTVAPLLGWAPLIDTAAVTQASGLTRDRVRSALAVLATSGRAGYDLAEAAYFHRELPFDPAHVTKLNPRLAAARALVEDDHVTRAGDGFEVRSGEQVYQVYPLAEGGFGCTCTWWVKHRGKRGPCKHALAALSAARAPVGAEQ
jgi:hypothetical protein